MPNLCHKKKKKKVTITVWAAAGLIHYSFLNTGETIISEKYAQQINELHHKLQHLQLALVDRKGLILLQDNAWCLTTHGTINASKLERIGLWNFALSTIFTWPLNRWLPLLQTSWWLFAKCFLNQQEAENTFQEFVKSWSMILMLQELKKKKKKTYFSLAKLCIL